MDLRPVKVVSLWLVLFLGEDFSYVLRAKLLLWAKCGLVLVPSAPLQEGGPSFLRSRSDLCLDRFLKLLYDF